MVNRRTNCYFQLPPSITDSNKQTDAKMAISINIVVPKSMEGSKLDKVINEMMESCEKIFKKYIKKKIEKALED